MRTKRKNYAEAMAAVKVTRDAAEELEKWKNAEYNLEKVPGIEKKPVSPGTGNSTGSKKWLIAAAVVAAAAVIVYFKK